MARGGRVVYKKSNRRKRRKPRSNGDEDDDDDDDEYVVGEDDEDEESESNYESDAESDEESYEFSESDEEKEIKNGRSKKGSKKVGSRNKTRVSDEEMEDLRVPKKRGRGRSRKQELRDSDYEFDDEDEEDEDFSPDDDDEFDEDEILVGSKRGVGKKVKKRGRKRKNIASPAGKRRMTENSDEDDEDFVVKDRVSVGRKRKRSKIHRRKRAKRSAVDEEEVSDFWASDDEDDEVDFVGNSIVVMKKNNKKNVKKTVRSKGRRKKRSAEDSESSDSDYVVSDDFVEKSSVVVNNKKKAKKTSGSKGRRKKKSVEISESSDSDYVISDDDDVDFDANDKIVLDKRQKKNEKENNVVVSSNRRKGRKSSVDSESSDSDYLMSDEDEQEVEEDEEETDEEEEDDFIVKDKFLIDKQHKKTSNTRKKRTEPKTRRKRSSSLVDSDLDFDKEISEEAVKDLRVGWNFDWLKPKRPVMKKKEEEEGKEKKIDSGKQVCGICLSEEQNGIVRGLLDCCSHYFCFACIMEWSKVESRCPVCKRRFVTITKSGKLNPASGVRNTVIRVQMKDQVYQPSEEELRGMLDPYENVVCMECQQGGDDNLMLLCDICDSSAHTYCVGLGREVPEGNWYCECCRPINEGLPHSHPQDTVTDEGANPSYLYSSVTVRSRSNNARVDTNSPRPVSSSGRPPSLRIDLNASPRDLPGDDNYVASPMSGSGASTLSGRRHIHQRIRILISSSRQRQSVMRTSVLGPGAEANVVTPENAQTEEALPSVLEFEDWQQNHRASLHSNASLAPCMFNEGSSFRHVEGAKEEVQSLVKRHLKKLARDMTLELTTLKEIVKNSTHTILAACGINHHRNNVPISIDPPEYCPHGSDDGPTHLVKNCCASCFDSFVEDVVQRQVNISR